MSKRFKVLSRFAFLKCFCFVKVFFNLKTTLSKYHADIEKQHALSKKSNKISHTSDIILFCESINVDNRIGLLLTHFQAFSVLL